MFFFILDFVICSFTAVKTVVEIYRLYAFTVPFVVNIQTSFTKISTKIYICIKLCLKVAYSVLKIKKIKWKITLIKFAMIWFDRVKKTGCIDCYISHVVAAADTTTTAALHSDSNLTR